MIPKQLQKRGFKFILVKKRGKEAVEKEWNTTNNYSFDDNKLRDHINNNGNYGVVCGNGLIVVDADSKKVYELVKDLLPPTFTIKTSKQHGHHYYYKCEGFNETKRLKDGETKIGDIQSSNTYVVAPNSTHPTGKKYVVVNDMEIVTVTKNIIDNVFRKFYASNERLGKEVILKGVSEGSRNETMFRMACSFRARGLKPEETLGMIQSINEKNNPSLPNLELNNIIQSAYKYPNQIKKAVKSFQLDYVEFAENFYDIQPFHYDKSKMWWLWNFSKCCWEIIDETDLLNEIYNSAIEAGVRMTASSVKSEIVTGLRMVGRKHTPLEPKRSWVQFKDKIFDIKTGEVFDATPGYLVCNPIPWSLGSSSDTPTIDKLFREWVPEKFVKTLYEIVAYCCLTDYPIHRAFSFIGTGRNGKTCYQNIIINFLGSYNICSTELDTLMDSRFESAKLHKKLLCSLGETNFGVFEKTGLFKRLTGQDCIGFEFKNKMPFDDYNYAKILINSNNLPHPEDTSDGFFRRWCIIDFPNNFPEGKDIVKTIPDIEYNNLAKKVVEILPGLLQNGRFTNEGDIKERERRYILASNPLPMFLEVACERNGVGFIRYSELFSVYCLFLAKMKRRIINRKEFNKILSSEGLEMHKTSHKIGDEYESGFFIEGIDWKPFVFEKGAEIGIRTIRRIMTSFSLSFSIWKSESDIRPKCHKCPKTEEVLTEFIKEGSKKSQDVVQSITSEELLLFVDNKISKQDFADKFSDERTEKLIKNGEIYENPSGILRVI